MWLFAFIGKGAQILNAINSAMSQKEVLIGQITSAMRTELIPLPGGTMSLADIDRRIEALNQKFQRLFAKSRDSCGYMQYADTFKRITNDMVGLKEKRAALLEQQNSDSAANRRIQDAVNILENGSATITEWDESIV